MNDWNNNNDGLPSYDEVDEKKAPIFAQEKRLTTKEKQLKEIEDTVAKYFSGRMIGDRGYYSYKTTPYDPFLVEVSTSVVAFLLKTSSQSVIRRLAEEGAEVRRSGKTILVPIQSAETLLFKSFKTLDPAEENEENEENNEG